MRGRAESARPACRLGFERRPAQLAVGFVTGGHSFVTHGVQRGVSKARARACFEWQADCRHQHRANQRDPALASLPELAARLSVGFWRFR